VIEVVDGLLDPATQLRVNRYRRRALQVQANREDRLDDFIVKFRGNAIAIAQDLSITAWTRRLSGSLGEAILRAPGRGPSWSAAS
jgi:hypothetical protein